MKLVHTGRVLPDDVWDRPLTDKEKEWIRAEIQMRRRYLLPNSKALYKLLYGHD